MTCCFLGFCDYADSIQPLEGDSHFLDHGTINFNSHRFMNSDDKTGVRLSWQPNGFIGKILMVCVRF